MVYESMGQSLQEEYLQKIASVMHPLPGVSIPTPARSEISMVVQPVADQGYRSSPAAVEMHARELINITRNLQAVNPRTLRDVYIYFIKKNAGNRDLQNAIRKAYLYAVRNRSLLNAVPQSEWYKI